MRPVKAPKEPAPGTNLPKQPAQKKTGGSGGMPAIQTGGVPTHALDMQRLMGNQATMQMIPQGNVIQRMPSDKELEAVAGKAQSDRFFGLHKMSQKYKDVLALLRQYREFGQRPLTSRNEVEVQDEYLDRIVKACNTYVTSHKDEKTRTPHIQAILNDHAPAERAQLQFLMTNFAQIKNKIMGKSIFEAMGMVAQMKTPTDIQGLMTFLSLETTKDTIRDQTKSKDTQPFRQSDELTAGGKSFTEIMGADYIKNTLAPHFNTVMSQTIGQNIVKSVGDLKAKQGELGVTPETLEKQKDTMALIRQLYEGFVTGLLQDTKGGTVLPQEILDGAAQVYATVYSTVSQDPAAQHSAEHSARVSVVNMIFLRFINPAIINIVAKLQEGGGKVVVKRLADIFQSQVNGVNVMNKYAELSESQDMILRVQQMIDTIINSVIGQGQLLAQQKKKN